MIRLIFLCILMAGSTAMAESRLNVLFIAIDDLNDWVGAFGGHPEAKTPHFDSFAKEGAVVFQNAHCPGPVCGPSRSALLSGFMPHTTGIYGNAQNMLDSKMVQDHATLPEYFSRHGYVTISRGKIAHKHTTAHGRDEGHWMYDAWEPARGGTGVDPKTLTSRDRNLVRGEKSPPSQFTQNSGSEFSWGVTRGKTEDTKDYLTAQWAAGQLAREHEKPFFLAVGLSKPHLPFYSPQEFWDRFPEDGDYLPEIREDDYDDILRPNGTPLGKKSSDYLWLEEKGLLNEAARAYLACSAYADHCLGVVFDALRESRHADNTIVVVWGDHGWHLGEKLRYRKASLWSESTRCPLMVRTPGMSARRDCARPINLIDFYPTLVELCGLPEKHPLDGRSFAALLKDPTQEWFPTLTVAGAGNASVHDGRWNLISRRDLEVFELYDLEKDPMEWTNLYGHPEFAGVQKRLTALVPMKFAPQVRNSKSDKKPRNLDETIRPKRAAMDLK